MLFQLWGERGLEQGAAVPTQGNHLLDLVLTDFGNEGATQMHFKTSGHKLMLHCLISSLPVNPHPARENTRMNNENTRKATENNDMEQEVAEGNAKRQAENNAE